MFIWLCSLLFSASARENQQQQQKKKEKRKKETSWLFLLFLFRNSTNVYQWGCISLASLQCFSPFLLIPIDKNKRQRNGTWSVERGTYTFKSPFLPNIQRKRKKEKKVESKTAVVDEILIKKPGDRSWKPNNERVYARATRGVAGAGAGARLAPAQSAHSDLTVWWRSRDLVVISIWLSVRLLYACCCRCRCRV